jgi:hypothetical protein
VMIFVCELPCTDTGPACPYQMSCSGGICR